MNLVEIVIAALASAGTLWTMSWWVSLGRHRSEWVPIIGLLVSVICVAIVTVGAIIAAVRGAIWLTIASTSLQVAVLLVRLAWTKIAVFWDSVTPPPPALDARIQHYTVVLVTQFVVWSAFVALLGPASPWQVLGLVLSVVAAYGVYRWRWPARALERRVAKTHSADVDEWKSRRDSRDDDSPATGNL